MSLSLSPRRLALFACLPALIQPAFAQNPEKADTLKVSVNVIPGAIRFETTRFDVTAGARVSLTFSNDCVMPHNLVLIQPDAEPALVAAVNTMGLEGMDKHFVPEVPGIIAATKLLQPFSRENLSFTAPATAGDYPYVCTFPGHWFTMRGVMRVRPAGVALAVPVKSGSGVEQVPDALKNSGMTHKPLGTAEKPFVMRTFAPDPGLDPAVFAHHGFGKDGVKYDPATRLDVSEKVTDPVTGVVKEVPVVRKAEKGVAGAIAVNHGPGFSYVWDSTECRLLYVWRGGFLDMDTYWGKEPGSGRPKMYIPLLMGHLVYRASGPMPLEGGVKSAPVFLGYKMDQGIPEFRYRVGTRTYREKVLPAGAEGFELRVTPEQPEGPQVWVVPPGDGAVTSVRGEAGAIVVSIKDRPEPPQPALKPAPEAKTKKP
jgi:azurin